MHQNKKITVARMKELADDHVSKYRDSKAREKSAISEGAKRIHRRDMMRIQGAISYWRNRIKVESHNDEKNEEKEVESKTKI